MRNQLHWGQRMRFFDRLLASCSLAAMLASFGAGTLVSSDAHAARPQAKPAASQPSRAAAVARPVPTRAAGLKPASVQSARLMAEPRMKVRSGMVTSATSKSGNIKSAKLRVAGTQSWGGISCVPFARAATGMDVKGNAHAWWDSAAGTYERGARPEAGSVLNFRATSRMYLGHVAVVARVIDGRTVEIDHANWAGPGGGKGRVARGVPVIDVSENNDWSAVQVGLYGGGFGSVYPTYGFIYDRPDRGVMVANTLARPGMGSVAVASARTSQRSEVADAWSARVLPASSSFGGAVGGRQSGFIDAPARTVR